MRTIRNGILSVVLVLIWSYGLFYFAKQITLLDKTDPPSTFATVLFLLGVIVWSVIIFVVGQRYWKEKYLPKYPTYKH